MQEKRFQKQIQTLMGIMGRTVPKKFHFVVGHNNNVPMGIRVYLTDEDPAVVHDGKGRTDHRYVTVEANYKDDALAVALRFDLNQPEGEQALLGHFRGNVNEKLHSAALTILQYLVNGDVPGVVPQ